MKEQTSRRRLIAGIATASLGGCLSLDAESKGSFLPQPLINNRDTEPHTVDFRVTWEGEQKLDRSYTISADDRTDNKIPGALPEKTWPDEMGQFTASARLSGGQWKTIDPGEYGYPDCFSVKAQITPAGTLAMLFTRNENLCPNLTDTARSVE